MWITLLVMAIAVSFEPFRLGMTVLMLNRPRPMLQLLAFLSGGFVMGMAVGLVVLFAFRNVSTGSAHFTLPRVQIGIGVAALLVAALVASRLRGPASPRAAGQGLGAYSVDRDGWLALGGRGRGTGHRVAVRGFPGGTGRDRCLGLSARHPDQRVADVQRHRLCAGGDSVPGSRGGAGATAEAMARLNSWIQSNRRRNIALVLTAVGCVLLAVGLAGI